MKRNLFLVTLIFTSLIACSKKEKDASATESNTDLYVASAQSAADEATDAITESGASASISPLTVNLEERNQQVSGHEFAPLTTGTFTRTCTEASGDASVLLSFSGSNTLTFSKTISSATIEVTIDVSRTGTETRVWSPATCTANTYANINWATAGVGTGLTLNVTLDRTINRAKTITVTKAAASPKTYSATDNVAVTGTRQITWAAPVSSGTANVSRTKTITSEVTRVRNFSRANGTTINSTETVTVGTASPLNVTVIRNDTTKALVSKTINSGTIKVSDSDGSYSSCALSNVTYDLSSSNTNRCLPTSGSITCQKFAASADATATAEVIISFGASTTSSVSVSVDGETAEDFSNYNSRGCDLEWVI
jgi:hypothetical protein